MNEQDYIVAEDKYAKPFLAQVQEISTDNKTLTAIVEEGRHIKPNTVTLNRKRVLVSLGKDPKPGKVYGIDVANLYRRSFTHEFWGTVHFFVKPSPEDMKLLRKALDDVGTAIEKLKLGGYVDVIHTQIRAKKGKYAGMYVHAKEGRHVWYAPECASGSILEMKNIVAHEYGHVLRFNGLTLPKARAKWLELFRVSVLPVVVPEKTLRSMFKAIKSGKDSSSEGSLASVLKEFEEQANDNNYAIYLSALSRWFRQVHHMSPKDLETLWDADKVDVIEELWPTSSIDTSKLDPIVSEYATKNVEELFAEAFTCYVAKKKLPKKVESLLEASLSVIRQGASTAEA